MKFSLKYLLLILLIIPFISEKLIGQDRIRILSQKQADLKSTGIGIRIGFFKMSDQPLLVDVHQDNHYSNVKVGYFCGSVYLFSRLNEQFFLDISLGGMVRVEEEQSSVFNEVVNVYTVVPILAGIRYNLLPVENSSDLQPYLSFGAGPYWATHVNVITEGINNDRVFTRTQTKIGAYLGGGLNFVLDDWIAFNMDVKYHFLNFDSIPVHNGFEGGIGVNFMWGSYR